MGEADDAKISESVSDSDEHMKERIIARTKERTIISRTTRARENDIAILTTSARERENDSAYERKNDNSARATRARENDITILTTSAREIETQGMGAQGEARK